jgi:hypothetical protein
MTVTIAPATADRWADLAELFGRGVVRQCACMWFRWGLTFADAGRPA